MVVQQIQQGLEQSNKEYAAITAERQAFHDRLAKATERLNTVAKLTEKVVNEQLQERSKARTEAAAAQAATDAAAAAKPGEKRKAALKAAFTALMTADAAAVADAELVGTELLAGFQFDDDNEPRKLGYLGIKPPSEVLPKRQAGAGDRARLLDPLEFLELRPRLGLRLGVPACAATVTCCGVSGFLWTERTWC